MTRFKYSRKEIAKNIRVATDCPYIAERLLATISKEDFYSKGWYEKEEQSQRIMMEQVPKDDYQNQKKIENRWGEVDLQNSNTKQNKPDLEYPMTNFSQSTKREKPVERVLNKNRSTGKPVCEHKWNIDTNGPTFCDKCGKSLVNVTPQYPPIEDTNKTSLEVPEKIDLEYPDEINKLVLAEKYNSLIDYLTLISLDKK